MHVMPKTFGTLYPASRKHPAPPADNTYDGLPTVGVQWLVRGVRRRRLAAAAAAAGGARCCATRGAWAAAMGPPMMRQGRSDGGGGARRAAAPASRRAGLQELDCDDVVCCTASWGCRGAGGIISATPLLQHLLVRPGPCGVTPPVPLLLAAAEALVGCGAATASGRTTKSCKRRQGRSAAAPAPTPVPISMRNAHAACLPACLRCRGGRHGGSSRPPARHGPGRLRSRGRGGGGSG